MNKTEQKRAKEQRVLGKMISLYCKKKHGSAGVLCGQCDELLTYALQKTEKCPFMENKTFCSNCKVHCYSPEMRQRIREVMRFSSPRMLLYYPHLAVWHLVCSMQEKKRLG